MTIPPATLTHLLRALWGIANAQRLTVPDLLRRWVREEHAASAVTVRGWRVAA